MLTASLVAETDIVARLARILVELIAQKRFNCSACSSEIRLIAAQPGT